MPQGLARRRLGLFGDLPEFDSDGQALRKGGNRFLPTSLDIEAPAKRVLNPPAHGCLKVSLE